MKQTLHISTYSLVAALFLATGCGLRKSNPEPVRKIDSVTGDRAAGKTLYAQNCLSCHGAIDSGPMLNKTDSEILAAIQGVSSMRFLSSLSEEQIRSIAAALVPEEDVTAPSVPAGVRVTTLGPTSLSLQWRASTDGEEGKGVAGYKVFYENSEIASLPSTDLALTVSNLVPSTRYEYRVLAYDGAGNASALSAPASGETAPPPAVPDTTAPTVPTGLSATVGSRKITLAWTASSDETGGSGLKNYRVFRNGSLLATVSPTSVTYDDLNVMAATSYSYQVSAQDEALNESAKSIAAAVRTEALNGVQLYANHCAGCHMPLASSNERNTTAQAIATAIGNANTPGTSARMSNLASLKALTQEEIAAIALVLSDASDRDAPTVPASPTLVSPAFDRVTLSWDAVSDPGNSGVRSYRVYRANTVVTTVAVSMPPQARLTFTDIGLTEQTAYRYSLDAVDNAGNISARSAVASITTGQKPAEPDRTPPSPPTGLSFVAGPNSITLSWNKPADNVGVTNYRVLRGTTLLPTVVNEPNRSLADVGLASSTAYAYQVEAYDAAGNKTRSAVLNTRTAAPNGTLLYTTRCQSCHGTLAASDLKFRAPVVAAFATLFENAIRPVAQGGVLAMQGKGLPRNEVEAIAALLVGEERANPVPSSTSAYAYSVPLGTRNYVASYLARIFLNLAAGQTAESCASAASPPALCTIIANTVQNRVSAFGGSCTLYEGSSCKANRNAPEAFTAASQSPLTSTARAGSALVVCAEIMQRDDAVNAALSKVSLTGNAAFSDANVRLVYGLFFPLVPLDTALRSSLQEIATRASTARLSGLDAWRLVMLPLCEAGALEGL